MGGGEDGFSRAASTVHATLPTRQRVWLGTFNTMLICGILIIYIMKSIKNLNEKFPLGKR